MPSASRPRGPRRSNSHRTTMSAQRTEVSINVYDLLPQPGKVSSFLWAIGSSLLHSGVVIKNKEYAYGGHDRPGLSGVYWTRPSEPPPGGTFRVKVLHGFTFRPEEELDEIIREASQKFQGTAYNLLTFNCNHFTSYLCEKLTGQKAPNWLNRAASIGLALPCVVPREWIAPPEYDTVDGELVEDDDERTAMLRDDQRRRSRVSIEEQDRWDSEMDRISSSTSWRSGERQETTPRLESVTDTSGRQIPVAERAPMPTGRR
ncbi:DUF862-domain-containing protein [Patellaria atrata CBS 101060]|uniref:DUF862-domain-containing protein n=1 Tax=Patellaria atrata CBS 101060 TaxID=1346257 RepID=A0A9P4SHA1_9PEZI|nr:DUF862-domain-containing protein [Patellaria atrata CBS 101060]